MQVSSLAVYNGDLGERSADPSWMAFKLYFKFISKPNTALTVFEQKLLSKELMHEIYKHYTVPDLLKPFTVNDFVEWSAHKDGMYESSAEGHEWYAQVQGSWEWRVTEEAHVPYECVPGDGFATKTDPSEFCRTEPGEILMVPHGWWRANCNVVKSKLSASIGGGCEFGACPASLMSQPDVVAMHFAALRGDLKQARTLALHCQTLLSADVVRTLQVKLLEKTSSLSLDDAGYFHFACRSGDLPTVQYIFGKFVSPAARLKAINNGIVPERLYKEYPILRITPVQWAAAQVHRIVTGRFPSSCFSFHLLHLQDAPVFFSTGAHRCFAVSAQRGRFA